MAIVEIWFQRPLLNEVRMFDSNPDVNGWLTIDNMKETGL